MRSAARDHAQAPQDEASKDEPRSRTPSGAANAATPDKLAAQIDIAWSEAAEKLLRSPIWKSGDESGKRAKAIDASSVGAKRACNLIARGAIKLALQNAQPLYSALTSHLEAMRVPVQWHIDLQWLDDEEIQAINRETRGKNKPTDVLSFPVWEGETFPMPPDENGVMLGDLLISIETAARQAAELGHDLRAEVAFLAVHGALHLLGYDHALDSQRRKMFALQDELVARVREARES